MSGGLDIKVNLVDAAGVAQWLRALYQDQIPYATKVALDATAFDARRTLVDELRQHFTVRTDWTARRMRVQKATKRDLVSYVGSTAPYMELQALGGVKRAKGPAMGIPTMALRKMSPDLTVRRKLWPNKLMKKRKRKELWTYIAPLRSGRGAVLFSGKMGDPKRRKGKALYYLYDKAHVPGNRWPIDRTVYRVVGAKWSKNAAYAMKRALKTARRRR